MFLMEGTYDLSGSQEVHSPKTDLISHILLHSPPERKHIKYLTCLSYHDTRKSIFITKLGSYWPSSAWGEQLPTYCRCFLLELCIFFSFLCPDMSALFMLCESLLCHSVLSIPTLHDMGGTTLLYFSCFRDYLRVPLRSNELQCHAAHFSTVRIPSE